MTGGPLWVTVLVARQRDVDPSACSAFLHGMESRLRQNRCGRSRRYRLVTPRASESAVPAGPFQSPSTAVTKGDRFENWLPDRPIIRGWRSDSGEAHSVEDEVVGGLKKLGLDPARIKYLIVSHGHFDHSGGATFLQDTYKARVLMSAADWDLLDRGNQNQL